MDLDLPKRLFKENEEPEVVKINNSCKTSLMKKLKDRMPNEYEEVKQDPVFAHILAIHEHSLGYSGKLVHSFMCKQLETTKLHELWFVFARRPLRFSLQEFYAVTGLNYVKPDNLNVEEWIDDDGFWSRLLRSRKTICLQSIKKKHLFECHDWTRVDRVRLVYLCVITSLLVVNDEKVAIPHSYIKLVMDIRKLQAYPWGLDSYDHLVTSIKAARVKLTQPLSYPVHGFTYALQIWIMEAIPDLGVMLGRKHKEDGIVFPRCSNWSGSAKISYAEINSLESFFGCQGVLYPYISSTGNLDIIDAIEFRRTGEMRDEQIDCVKSCISSRKDWSDHIWQVTESPKVFHHNVVEEVEMEDENEAVGDVASPNVQDTPGSSSNRGKKKFSDNGVEKRKQKLLCLLIKG